jgi:hypothetical protein
LVIHSPEILTHLKYERYRTLFRTEPIIRVDGILERHADGGGAINLLAKNIHRLTPRVEDTPAGIAQLHQPEPVPATTENDFAAVAPPAMSFAQGRRR